MPTPSPAPTAARLDPTQVPVSAVDTHLPRVAPFRLTAAGLRQHFAHPPAWEPELRSEPAYLNRPWADAAVLVPIVLREQLTVLLTQRTAHLSTHSGQIALPGGRVDAQDADAVAAALRESEEEIGLHAHWVEVLGNLPVYLTGSAYRVKPVVALIDPRMTLKPNPHEVADVFEVPLAFLMNPANHRHHHLNWQGVQRHWLSMPYAHAGESRFIWGATAGMLRNFYRFLQAPSALP